MDLQKTLHHTQGLDVFGVNPLFCYVLSEVWIILADYLPLQGRSIHQVVYEALAVCTGDNAFTSLLYAVLTVCLVGIIGLALYRKNIYIKI